VLPTALGGTRRCQVVDHGLERVVVMGLVFVLHDEFFHAQSFGRTEDCWEAVGGHADAAAVHEVAYQAVQIHL